MKDDARAGARFRGVMRSPVRLAWIVCIAVFVWAIAQFYQSGTGFSSLIAIGDAVEERAITPLREVPHFVYDGSAGYDGAYYVQIALSPLLQNPELADAIDNLPYRARRILFCWLAWLLGLGQPAWVVQAHALLNVFAWFGLAWLLTRWFPPSSWDRFLRWFAIMFSHGLCMSVRDSLVDGPSLLVVGIAMRCIEEGQRKRGGLVLAVAGLGKETSLLAVSGLLDIPSAGAGAAAWRQPQRWLRFAGVAGMAALPLFLWIAYIRWKLGPTEDPGLGNFGLPLAGLAEKWGEAVADLGNNNVPAALQWATLAATLALTVQVLFFVSRWQPRLLWWRIGAMFAAMALFLSTPVWEGYPGAASRVLLPMTLAFNVLVPRGRRWMPLLVAGNLSVLAAVHEFSPPHEFYSISGDRGAVAGLDVKRGDGWYGSEYSKGVAWRWAREKAALRLRNASGSGLTLTFAGRAASAMDTRELRVSLDGTELLARTLGPRPSEFRFTIELPPGEAVVEFRSDQPPRRVGEDERMLAFRVQDLEISVALANQGARQ